MAERSGSDGDLGLWDWPNEAILSEFVRITGHDSGGTANTRRSAIRTQLRRHEVAGGAPVRLVEVVTNPELLADILRCDQSLTKAGRISYRAAVGVRYAFAALVVALPPPVGFSRDDLRHNVQRARTLTTEVRGLRRVLRLGRQKEPDDRPVPTRAEIERIIAALRADGATDANHVADIIGICYLTGARIGAVLSLTRDDILRMPDGRCWVFLYEKSRTDRRPVQVRTSRAGVFEEWERLPPGSTLWPCDDGQPLSYRRAARLLHSVREAVELPEFMFHRVRHAFATDLGAHVGLDEMRRAGGWRAERVAESYMHHRDPEAS